MGDYMDKSLSPAMRAELLLVEMTLDEKMAQVNCAFPYSADLETSLKMAEYKAPLGAGHVSCLIMRDLETLDDAVRLQRALQQQIMEKIPHHIPAIFHMEGLCGAFLQGAASFPSGYARGASWDPALEREIGAIVGRQERCVGITQTLAPVLDISRDQRMGRCAETYGEDPTLTAALGAAYAGGLTDGETVGLRSEGVAKHFLGFHASEGGIHGTACSISERALREVYAKPFQAAITESGLRGIMPCYNPINSVPASASREILTGLLRDEMGFEGMCVSDYCAISNLHAVQGMYETEAEAGYVSMSAGMDAELQICNCFNDELKEKFRTGEADIAVLDTAVRRILESKFRMGLFDRPFALEGEELYRNFHTGEEETVSLQSAREALVLLKNDDVLPIRNREQKIAVIGCFADDPRYMFGGYTHFSMAEGAVAAVATMAGVESKSGTAVEVDTIPGTVIQRSDDPKFRNILRHQKPEQKSLLEVLREKMPAAEICFSYGYDFAGTDESHFAEALEAAAGADLVIVTLGGKHGTSTIASMGEGMDGTNINLPPCQENFLRKLDTLDKPVVAVHFDGRAISSDVAEEVCGAILEAWNPAEGGSVAVAEALLGEYNPGGKLPVSVAYCAAQLPVYYNHYNNCSYHQGGSIAFADYVDCPHHPRYYFGYGLSYTSFAYDNLKLSTDNLRPGESLKVEFDLSNTGDVYGDEVVQLYFSDRYATVIRPIKELCGFKRVGLAPGETRHLTFTVRDGQFAFLDSDMKWRVEKGEMKVEVAASVEDVRLSAGFWIAETSFVEGKARGFYAAVTVE